jgi:hypothetical protein
MKRITVFLFIGILALIGCGTSPQEFSVSDVPVYMASNPDRLFTGEETFTMKFADNDRVFNVGRIEDGKLTFTLSNNVSNELFDNPEYLVANSITSGLNIATGIFFPDIYIYDIFNKREYRFIYANKNGSFILEDIKYTLTYGWNLITQEEKSLDASKILNSLQYRWVCDTNMSAREYVDAHKNLWENSANEKAWWEE